MIYQDLEYHCKIDCRAREFLEQISYCLLFASCARFMSHLIVALSIITNQGFNFIMESFKYILIRLTNIKILYKAH